MSREKRLSEPNYAIKGKRAEMGMTQEFVADKLGISGTAYNLKENGWRDFWRNELVILARLFGCHPSDLIIFDQKVSESIQIEKGATV